MQQETEKKKYYHLGILISGIVLILLNVSASNIFVPAFVVLTILSLIRLGLGIATVVMSIKANTAHQNDDDITADSFLTIAKRCNLAGWIVVGVTIVFVIVAAVLSMFAAMSGL